MINWKATILGFILAIVLGILFLGIGGIIGLFIGLIIAGGIVGYMVNVDIKNGVIHGALIGVIGGIISIIILTVIALASRASVGALITLEGVVYIILLIVIWTIFGLIGGVIGSLIRIRQIESMTMPTTGKTEAQSSEEKPKIEFTMDNVSKCICTQCPVQAESECAQTKMKMLQESMTGMSPEPSDVPGVYCATGVATCGDLDPDKTCNCPNCEVFKENELAQGEPGGYFCQNGMAR